MKWKVVLTMITAISGCSDYALQHHGTQSIAYQEVHRFEFSFPSQHAAVDRDQLATIIAQFDASKAHYTLRIPHAYQQQGRIILKSLQQQRVPIDRIDVQTISQGKKIELLISQWRSITDYCRPLTIAKPQPQAGCAVETNRTLQLVNIDARVN
ncbi:hypothetical protein ACPV5U_26860 [Vibrio mediterranei]